MTAAAVAILIGGGIGALGQIFGAKAAANAQTSAATAGIAAQLKMWGVTQANLAPFVNSGVKSLTKLNNNWKFLKTQLPPVDIDLAKLEATPGYQWALAQGEKGVTNQLTARGLGMSGASIKGGEAYASGLAQQTFQQEFQRQMANRQLALSQKEMLYNMIMGPAQLGEAAAAGTGTAAMNTGSAIAQGLSNIGSAQAGAATSIGSAFGDFGSSIAASQTLPALIAASQKK